MALKDNLEWRESNDEKCMVDIKVNKVFASGYNLSNSNIYL